MKKIRRILWGAVVIAVSLFLVAQFTIKTAEYDKMVTSTQVADNASEDMLKPEYTLTNHNQDSVSSSDFNGQWQLVFFGFTHCPEICPVTMGKITSLMNALGESDDDIVPIFISVDPERDTPEVISEYLKPFHQSIVGLTGSQEQIEQTADEFKVYYSKIENPTNPDFYMINHSSFMYLLNPEGVSVEIFSYDDPVEDIQHSILEHLKTLG